jgi:glycerol-3-phosphate acyltransferase PlsY
MSIFVYVFAILLGYLVGSLPFGFWIARRRGIDVRTIASGRTGATNVYRALGARVALLTGVLDFLKGAVVVLVTRALFHNEAAAALAGAAAIAGHNWSVFLNFKGGAGGSTGGGALLALNPLAGAIVVPIFLLILFVGRYASIATLSIGLGSVVVLSILHFINPALAPAAQFLFAFPALIMIAITLRPNLDRLRKGTERRIDFNHT